jgi:hypothetical protein
MDRATISDFKTESCSIIFDEVTSGNTTFKIQKEEKVIEFTLPFPIKISF